MTKEKAIKLFHDLKVRVYWNDLKKKLKEEGSGLSEKIGQLKMQSPDGKLYKTDISDTEQLLQMIN